MGGRVRAVRHAGVSVTDMERSLHFYRDLLGLAVLVLANEHGAVLEEVLGFPDVRVTTAKLGAPEGVTLVELLRYDNPRAGAAAAGDVHEIGASHIALTVDDLDDLYGTLSKAGVPFRSPPRVSPDGRAKLAFCADPDGTAIELVEPL